MCNSFHVQTTGGLPGLLNWTNLKGCVGGGQARLRPHPLCDSSGGGLHRKGMSPLCIGAPPCHPSFMHSDVRTFGFPSFPFLLLCSPPSQSAEHRAEHPIGRARSHQQPSPLQEVQSGQQCHRNEFFLFPELHQIRRRGSENQCD